MKISKLFHWLYASVMFLPLFFLLPTAFYYGFNEHAKNETTTEVDIQYKYETNEVNSLNDIVLNNIYYANNFDLEVDNNTSGNTEHLSFELLSFSDLSPYPFSISDEDFYDFYSNGAKVYLYVDIAYQENSYFILQVNFGGDSYVNYTINSSNIVLTDCNFRVIEFLSEFKHYYQWSINEYDASLPTSSDFNVIENVDVQTDVSQSITQSMGDAWQGIWDLPMFSWTSNTFFSAPFTYIADLFGIEATNPLCNALSYWFSISIIWLTFDLFIYVPLLVHRWLDKGVLE